jgi:uncharacterized protein
MAKIVLDTNIIVRAVASPSGLASELLRRTISDENLLCTCNFMLAELDRVLRYPRVRKIHGLSDTEIEDLVRSIQQVALVVEVDAAKSVRVTRDKDDDPVIETALRSKADYLCSIDKDIGATDVVDHCKAVGVEGCHRYSAHRNSTKSRSGIVCQAARFCRHIFAHPFLASLSRAYLGLHHAHQKFSLLVLVQFVPKVVIHLAGPATEASRLVGRRRQTAENSKSAHRSGLNQTIERSLRRLLRWLQLSICWT